MEFASLLKFVLPSADLSLVFWLFIAVGLSRALMDSSLLTRAHRIGISP